MAIFGNIRQILDETAPSAPLQTALDFACEVSEGRRLDLQQRAARLKAGESFNVELQGKEIFAIFQAYVPRARKNGFFEAHKEFTDIQFLLQGAEYIELAPLRELAEQPTYDENQNVFFPLSANGSSRLLLKPGVVAVLFPGDAHAPTLEAEAPSSLNVKVVIKVQNALERR